MLHREADSRLGDYTLEELCRIVHHRMGLEVTRKNMSARIATNVNSERSHPQGDAPVYQKFCDEDGI